MKVVKFTQEAVYDYLDTPYNPPIIDELFTEEAFANEWHSARNQLKAMLDRHGVFDSDGGKDYYLGDSLTLSRGIGLEVTSERLLNKCLLPDTIRLLSTFKQQYEVDYAILTTDGIYHVFVSNDEIKTNCPTPLFSRLTENI